MSKTDKIYVAGHKGLAGSAICRILKKQGYSNILTVTHQELDLTRQEDVENFFSREKPDHVFLAAAKVGGIWANNSYPADFIHENLLVQSNVIHASYLHKIKRLLFLGSSCIYPRDCPQPIKESSLLTSPLEETNEAYAIAKISGLKMCQAYNRQYGTTFLSVMPTNLFGINDNFNLQDSHVIPALIRKFHEAKTGKASKVVVWGSGKPRREFLYVDDFADACLFLMNLNDEMFSKILSDKNPFVNIGFGSDLTIKDLVLLIGEITGFSGNIEWDTGKPDGTPRKFLDVSKMTSLGWRHQTSLEEGLRQTYKWFCDNGKIIRS